MILIPTEPEELTPDWLTTALRGHEAFRTVTVTGVTSDAIAENKGFFAQIWRLGLKYERDEADAPRTLIAKLSSPTAEMRQRPNTIAAYRREVHFYQRLAERVSLRVPTFFYADIDVVTGHHVLLLEDLAPSRSSSRVAGCTPEQARIAVRQIAAFHAEWWESLRLAELDWIHDSPFSHEALVEAHASWWPEFLRLAGHRVPETLLGPGEQLGHHRAALYQHLWSTPPLTLTHGDYQLDNLLFAARGGGIPCAVVDWQSIGWRRGIWDIGLFLGQNLDPEVRSAIEMDLLAEYLQSLTDNGVRGYDFDQCLDDYRRCLLLRFGSLISTIAAMPFTKEQIALHIDILLPRNVAALLDLDAASLLA